MFENFSKINYKLAGNTVEFTDIFKNIKINTENSPDINTTTISGYRPDQFSNVVYNDPKLFWVTLLLNNIKNPFTEWNNSLQNRLTINDENYGSKIFQFGNISPYLSGNTANFDEGILDSYKGISLGDIQQDDVIVFETGSGAFELKTYGAGQVEATSSCGYPHFGQSLIPDNFLNRNNIIQISCGKNFTACLDDTGYIWAWGEDIGLESSGFSLNGRLYRSPSGQYKFIDTTRNKIIAITYYGDLQCFGECGDFTYSGYTDLVKTSWTNGQTLAGLAIKSDNTLQVFGPIISTDNTVQYYSNVSCADDYCLGVATGPGSNNQVIGFGATGYFSEVTQAVSYSKTVNDLGPLTTDNPLYPLTDNSNKFLKENNKGILELKLKDLPPFTSPSSKNSEEAYRSDYLNVFADSKLGILLGTTDINSYSKEGFIINNPKLFALPGNTFEESREFSYSNYYDSKRKPAKHFDLFDRLTFTTGITSIQDVKFSRYRNIYVTGLTLLADGSVDAISVVDGVYPSFYFTDKNLKNSNSYFAGPFYYENINIIGEGPGITRINDNISYYGNYSYINDKRQSFRIKKRTVIYDWFAEPALDLLEDDTLKINSNGRTSIPIIDPLYEFSPDRQAVYFANKGGGFTAYVDDTSFWSNFGPIKYMSQSSSHGPFIITSDGTPYLMRQVVDDKAILADTNEEVYGLLRNFYQDILPPAGVTFKKIENAAIGDFYAAGIASDDRIHLMGVTASLQPSYGITTTHYIIPGITAKDITVNSDNIVILKNNGTISVYGGPAVNGFNNLETDWSWGGFTVSNAVKILGPDSIAYGQTGLVLTSDGKAKILAYTPNSVGQNNGPDDWRNATQTIRPGGITLAGFRLPTKDPQNKVFIEYYFDFFQGKNIDIWNDLNDGSIVDIDGTSASFMIYKQNGEKIWTISCPFGGFNLTGLNGCIWNLSQLFLKFGHTFNKPLYRGDYWQDMVMGNTFDNIMGGMNGYFGMKSDFAGEKLLVEAISDSSDFSFDNTMYAQSAWNYNNDSIHGLTKKRYYAFNGVSSVGYWNFDSGFYRLDVRILYAFLTGGITAAVENIGNYGASYVIDKKYPVIVCKYPFDFNYLVTTPSSPIEDVILGDGYAILTHPDKKISMIYGENKPYPNVPDFSDLSTINTTSLNSQEQFEFWEKSLISKLAIGDDLFCGYKPEYTSSANILQYWGNTEFRTKAPQTDNYTDIDCFHSVCCGVRQDNGLVECWGTDVWDIIDNIPSNLGPCVHVAVGKDHACAENVFGQTICWGNNKFGQCGVPPSVNDGTGNKYLDCGDSFTVVCKNDNRVIAWGLGLTGSSETVQLSGSSIPTELSIP